MAMRACVVSVSGPVLRNSEADFLSKAQPFGVILMGRSIQNPAQVRALVDAIWTALGRACLVFVDQEGGRVARLRPPHWRRYPPASVYGALYARSRGEALEAVWLGYRLIAADLAPLGIHADCAPVLDLPVKGASDVIGDRALSARGDVIAHLGRSALAGLQAGGVVGAIKHMPGHGRAMVDTHEGLPVVDATLPELAADFAPFAALHDASMGLTAHVAYSAIDGDRPATLSKRVIEWHIRRGIAFDGLLLTDDLGMNALGGTLASRAQGAIDAGCDIVLHCAGFVKDPDAILAEMVEVAAACPVLGGKSLKRAEAAMARAGRPEPFDAKAAEKRFAELVAPFWPGLD
jgi:beta-N-acetylhexosaminidase